MKTGQSFFPSTALLAAVLTCVPLISAAYDAEETGGWQHNHVEKPDSWQEMDAALPAYPEKKNLLDLGIGTDDMQFTVYLDKPSLVLGEDGVVRYTVVLVSNADVWNVSNEGLRCGEKQFRRYAYGANGEWQPLNNSPWSDVRGNGSNRYRQVLYADYFCNPTRPYKSAREMIGRFSENWHEM